METLITRKPEIKDYVFIDIRNLRLEIGKSGIEQVVQLVLKESGARLAGRPKLVCADPVPAPDPHEEPPVDDDPNDYIEEVQEHVDRDD